MTRLFRVQFWFQLVHYVLYFEIGMWGAKLPKVRKRVAKDAEAMLVRDHEHLKGCDQDLLELFMWPTFKQSMV